MSLTSRIPVFFSAISCLLLNSVATLPVAPAPAKSARKPAAAAVKRRPGYVVGRCLNTGGKPLRGVRIRVFGTSSAGENANFETRTDAGGRYAVKLPRGNFHVGWALYDTPAPAGPAYSLPLHPNDGNIDDASSAPGIIENFTLKISGRISPLKDAENELSYYGGAIRVFGGALENGNMFDGHTYRFPAGAAVELNLAPAGRLADGSAGKTIVRRKPVVSSAVFLDVPVGSYQVTARLVQADGTVTPLRIAAARFGVGTMPTRFTPGPADFAPSARVYFPSTGNSTPLLTLPGVAAADVYVQP